jgi:N-acetyl-anhydromuramyl-L-alanine amidase AmpD
MVVVHCTASPDSADHIGVDEVRMWHKQRGWSDVGYHWIVTKQGEVQQGRVEDIAGAHAYGYNSKSIGICWVGLNSCLHQQLDSLTAKIAEIVIKYDIPIDNVVGHCELPGVRKTCPNLSMTYIRNVVQQLTGMKN